jgi:purine-cytosine permease-like protein
MLSSSLLRKGVIFAPKCLILVLMWLDTFVNYYMKTYGWNMLIQECSSFEAAKFSLVTPCATLLCWWLLVLNNFLPLPLLMKQVLIKKKKERNRNPLMEIFFL